LRQALGSIRREDDMTIRIQPVLMLLCLGLSANSVEATETAQGEVLKSTQSGTAETPETEAVRALETDAAQPTATEAVQTDGPDAAVAMDTEAVRAEATDAAATTDAEAVRTDGPDAAVAADTEAVQTDGPDAAVAADTEAVRTEEADAAATADAEAVQTDGPDAAVAADAEAVRMEETDAAATADLEAVQTDGPDTAVAADTEAVRAEEADTAATADIEAVQTEEAGTDSLFSRIVEWFRGDGSETDSKTDPQPPEKQEAAEKTITLSHAYQATRDMIAEIEILRQATGVSAAPRETAPRDDRAPIHAYSKSLEVMEKTARVQRRLGMIPVEVGNIPVRRIAPDDLYRSVQDIIAELRRIKRQLVIEDQIQPASFTGGTTPALLYRHLGDASFLMDGLVGRPTTSNDVYLHVLRVHDEMESIATGLGVALESDPPVVEGDKESKEVAQQMLRATYKVINLQSRLGMDASGVPNSTLERVTPAEVFDATNILLAEIVRIKTHLNVPLPRAERRESRNKQPRDVFAEVLLVIRNLDALTRAADNTG